MWHAPFLPIIVDFTYWRCKEYDPVIWFLCDFGSQAIQIYVQPSQSPFADWHYSIPLAFSLPNSYEAVLLIYIVEFVDQGLEDPGAASAFLSVASLDHGVISSGFTNLNLKAVSAGSSTSRFSVKAAPPVPAPAPIRPPINAPFPPPANPPINAPLPVVTLLVSLHLRLVTLYPRRPLLPQRGLWRRLSTEVSCRSESPASPLLLLGPCAPGSWDPVARTPARP